MTTFTHTAGTFTLNNSVSLYIPTVYANHDLIEEGKVNETRALATARIADFFGGATVIEGTGYFVHISGVVQEEKVFIINAFADDDSLSQYGARLKTLAGLIATQLEQECVLLVVNGQAGFYEGK
jgi:hypothetical protein